MLDPQLRRASAGARVLRQDPVECLFQFVCSSNNHIARIHGMVERLCSAYGTPLPVLDKAAAAGLPEAGLQPDGCCSLRHYVPCDIAEPALEHCCGTVSHANRAACGMMWGEASISAQAWELQVGLQSCIDNHGTSSLHAGSGVSRFPVSTAAAGGHG